MTSCLGIGRSIQWERKERPSDNPHWAQEKQELWSCIFQENIKVGNWKNQMQLIEDTMGKTTTHQNVDRPHRLGIKRRTN
ncbi:hypothetical protein NPIL_372841 [Nephila pilipes]|uniref:Uncharacterized protein n=1 Tax=Nephila pilipes TaxID=299642 RepID=A0A8X6NKT6_NEPPI|nr:hypothetical protein NPIL_372841 [Nephila pilipes]